MKIEWAEKKIENEGQGLKNWEVIYEKRMRPKNLEKYLQLRNMALRDLGKIVQFGNVA
jgi:hypothetical protein